MIYYDIKESVFGWTLIAHTQKGICAILLNNPLIDLDDQLEKIFPKKELIYVYSPQYALSIIQKINDNQDLNKLPIDIISGTPFQKSVWEELRKIKSGITMTYSELATNLGMSSSVRAVASAVGKNPISIIIPCHRILPRVGGIGRYRWGPEMKRTLLKREGIDCLNV